MTDDELSRAVTRIERILASNFYMYSDQGGNNLWYTYRMTRQQVAELMCKQHGYCACCDKDLEYCTWDIEHKHGTFLIRGITCHACNTGIGRLGDSIEGLMRAVAYLKRFEERERGRLQAIQHPVVKADDS